MVLLYSVLNAILNFLSFMKVLVKVWKRIVKIYMRILWGEANVNDKIPWWS